jgi:PEP-CTERM motif
VALPFAVCSAQAQGIIYMNYYPGYLPPTSLDLDGDGQADFSATWSGAFIGTTDIPQSFASTSWSLNALSGGSFNVNVGGLAAGTVIGASSGFWSADNASATLSILGEHLLLNTEDWTGVLAPDSSGLVAVRFAAQDGFTHYGWIRFRLPTAPAQTTDGTPIEFGPQIAEYAWDTVPNQFIIAGAVPEPSTWALLTIGALFALHRRRIP